LFSKKALRCLIFSNPASRQHGDKGEWSDDCETPVILDHTPTQPRQCGDCGEEIWDATRDQGTDQDRGDASLVAEAKCLG
jgi:hypothetical protein